MNISLWQRFTIVFILGFASGLPYTILGSTLQAWFADAGLDVATVGLVSLMGLPYSYRMFFAPLVDKYTFFGMKRRRAWMISMQLLLVFGVLALSFFTPHDSCKTMLLLAFILSICSALLDVAIDAQRIEYLTEENYALGAALAIFGYRIAMLIGSGFILVFASLYGFNLSFRLLAILIFLGLFTAFISQEPEVSNSKMPTGTAVSWGEPFKQLFSSKNITWICIFIFLYKFGEVFTTTSSGIIMPFLRQELQFSLATIGYVNKIVGIGALLVGGLISGLILKKYSLFKTLLYIGIAQACSNILFIILAINGKVLWLLVLAVFCDNLIAGMGATALVTLIMEIVDTRYTATQFSILISISSLPRIFSGPIGAYLQSKLGWVNLFAVSCVLALFFIPVLLKLRNLPRMPLEKW